jgi:hypothetical protein
LSCLHRSLVRQAPAPAALRLILHCRERSAIRA